MKAARFDHVRPDDLDAAIVALGSDGAKPLGGGQSLGPMLNLRLARPSLLVNLPRLPEMRAVEDLPEGVMFGAGFTHAEFEDGVLPDPTHGILPSIARGIAYRAVRNRGTIGGSLAHADPAADWPTTLAALGASVRLAGPSGERRMAVEDFVIGPFETALTECEIVTGVFVPRLSENRSWSYVKSCRKTGEFAEAMTAVLADPERGVCRLVIGALEARAIVIPDAETIIADPRRLEALLDTALGDSAADPAQRAMRLAVARKAIGATQKTEHVA